MSELLIYLGGADAKVPESFFLERKPLIPQRIATTEGYVTDVVTYDIRQPRSRICLHLLKGSLRTVRLNVVAEPRRTGGNYLVCPPLIAPPLSVNS